MSDDLQARFQQAAADVKALASRPSDNDLLVLYGQYKQATEGDVTGDRPGMFDFKGGAKYDAWAKLKGTSKEDAMAAYVEMVGRLKG